MSREPDQYMTADEIESQVCGAMNTLALEIKRECEVIRKLSIDGQIPNGQLLVNFELAKRGLAKMQKFYDKELHLKLKLIAAGDYRWRTVEELAAQREKRKKSSEKLRHKDSKKSRPET